MILLKKINERKNEMTGNVQFELFLGVYYKKWRTTGSIYTKERWNNNGDLGVKTAEKRNPKSWGKPVSYFNLGGGGGESFDFFPLHSKSFQIKFSISQWVFLLLVQHYEFHSLSWNQRWLVSFILLTGIELFGLWISAVYWQVKDTASIEWLTKIKQDWPWEKTILK